MQYQERYHHADQNAERQKRSTSKHFNLSVSVAMDELVPEVDPDFIVLTGWERKGDVAGKVNITMPWHSI